jgi:hypothetical protein
MVFVQILLIFHSPISAKAFYYFDCHRLAKNTSFLRHDYNVECWAEKWVAFLPFALVLLIGFAVAVPFLLGLVLWSKRATLHTPAVRQNLGFLYNRYQKGAEFWEVHELFRKMLLTGLLVYLPSTTRTAAAILICVFAVASLNYFRPHSNVLVFWVCQISFVLTTCKYIITVMTSMGGEDDRDDVMLGVLLVSFDVVAFLLGGLCIVVIFGLFVCHKKESSATTIVPQRAGPTRTTRGMMKESSATRIVPQPTGAKRTTRGIRKQMTEKGSMRYNVKVALLMKKAGDAANAHEESRDACLKAREREKKSAKNRLSNRLRERSQLTEGRKLRVEKSNE